MNRWKAHKMNDWYRFAALAFQFTTGPGATGLFLLPEAHNGVPCYVSQMLPTPSQTPPLGLGDVKMQRKKWQETIVEFPYSSYKERSVSIRLAKPIFIPRCGGPSVTYLGPMSVLEPIEPIMRHTVRLRIQKLARWKSYQVSRTTLTTCGRVPGILRINKPKKWSVSDVNQTIMKW